MTSQIPEHIRRIQIPTEVMEQEFGLHQRRGRQQERARVLSILNMLAQQYPCWAEPGGDFITRRLEDAVRLIRTGYHPQGQYGEAL